MTVFLSYASGDKPSIRKLIAQLKAKGIIEPQDEVLDTLSAITVPGSSLRGALSEALEHMTKAEVARHLGEGWRGQIREAIENSSKFVVVWSDAAGTSDWVNYETGMAEALGKPILVVIPKGGTSRLPWNLKENQVVEVE
jgi:TIR domain